MFPPNAGRHLFKDRDSFSMAIYLVDFNLFETLTSSWFQPIWKILYSQNGNLPQVGVNINMIWVTTT